MTENTEKEAEECKTNYYPSSTNFKLLCSRKYHTDLLFPLNNFVSKFNKHDPVNASFICFI